MDYPEEQFVDCHLTVSDQIICVGCRLPITSERVVPEFRASNLEPADKKATRYQYTCACGAWYMTVLVEDAKLVNTEVSVELTAVVCGKCREALYARRVKVFKLQGAPVDQFPRILLPSKPDVLN